MVEEYRAVIERERAEVDQALAPPIKPYSRAIYLYVRDELRDPVMKAFIWKCTNLFDTWEEGVNKALRELQIEEN
jgi:hypothetical protein